MFNAPRSLGSTDRSAAPSPRDPPWTHPHALPRSKAALHATSSHFSRLHSDLTQLCPAARGANPPRVALSAHPHRPAAGGTGPAGQRGPARPGPACCGEGTPRAGSPAGCSSMAKAAMSARMAGKRRRPRLCRARSNGAELPAAVTSEPAPDMVSGMGRDGPASPGAACPLSVPWQPGPPGRAWCEQSWGSRGYLTRAENPQQPQQGRSRRFWPAPQPRVPHSAGSWAHGHGGSDALIPH